MRAKVIVTTQYYENYNVNAEGFGETPYWKPKGSHQFVFPVEETYNIMYAGESEMRTAITNLLSGYNTIAERFEYISYEMEYSDPTPVMGLEAEIARLFKEK